MERVTGLTFETARLSGREGDAVAAPNTALYVKTAYLRRDETGRPRPTGPLRGHRGQWRLTRHAVGYATREKEWRGDRDTAVANWKVGDTKLRTLGRYSTA